MITLSDLKRLLAPIQKKIFLSLARAILAVVNNTEGTQKIQVTGLSNEVITDIERFQEYGFETYPWPDAEVCTIFLNGNRDHGIVVCVHDRRYRLMDLAEGEIAHYTDEDQLEHGHRVHFKRNQELETRNRAIDTIAYDTIREETTDRTLETNNDRVENIDNDETKTVGNDETKTVGNDHVEAIGNDETKTVGRDVTVTIGRNRTITIVGDSEVNCVNATLNCSGKATINAATGVDVDGGLGNLTGVVCGRSYCHFTGQYHSDLSQDVKASKT